MVMNNKLERIWKEVITAHSTYTPGNYLDALMKTKETSVIIVCVLAEI
jgi:hypothetical protein